MPRRNHVKSLAAKGIGEAKPQLIEDYLCLGTKANKEQERLIPCFMELAMKLERKMFASNYQYEGYEEFIPSFWWVFFKILEYWWDVGFWIISTSFKDWSFLPCLLDADGFPRRWSAPFSDRPRLTMGRTPKGSISHSCLRLQKP